uniref:Odorant-binding protein n=1 Tax=Galeruca daurica TaxID=1651263 RepID=A0A1U9W512_9CUCU|nr:odorant-binding protein [Galeruca daurica]
MNKSIIFAVLCIGVASCYLPESEYGIKLQKLAKESHDECIEQTGTTQAAIERVKQGKFDDDIKIKEYNNCLWIFSKVLNENFELNSEILKEILPEKIKDVQLKALMDCQEEIKGTAGADQSLVNKTYSLSECVCNKNPKTWIFF